MVTKSARKIRAGLDEGIDPLAERDRIKPAKEDKQAKRHATAQELAQRMTSRQCAVAFIDSHRSGWKSSKHSAQWTSAWEAYAYPIGGALPSQIYVAVCSWFTAL